MGRVGDNIVEQREQKPVVRIRKEQSDYRQVDRLSFSALAKFCLNRKAFVKEYILHEDDEKCDEEDNKFLRFGSILDMLETDEENFEKIFKIASAPIPTPQMANFCKYLRDCRLSRPEATFAEISDTAYKLLEENNDGKKISTGYVKFIEKFTETGSGYYQELIDSVGKVVVNNDEVSVAKQVLQKIRDSKAFDVEHDLVLKKLPIYFQLGEFEMKAELDKVYVSHKTKTLYLRDLKTSSFVESFFRDGFLKRLYFIQGSLYKFALLDYIVGTEYDGYKVENMAFEVVDSGNWTAPLLYTTSDEHYEQGFNGFFYGGRFYKGITTILDEIKQHKELNNWTMSIENINRNGKVQIPKFKNELEYDS